MMLIKTKNITLILLILTTLYSCSTKKHLQQEFPVITYGNISNVKFVNNYDGDTLTIDIPNVHPLFGNKIRVRIYGIDTAEIKSKNSCERQKAIEAKDLAYSILSKARKIELRNVQRDKYFRILAEVYADGTDVSKQMLEHKLAVPYFGDKKPKIDWCKTISGV